MHRVEGIFLASFNQQCVKLHTAYWFQAVEELGKCIQFLRSCVLAPAHYIPIGEEVDMVNHQVSAEMLSEGFARRRMFDL